MFHREPGIVVCVSSLSDRAEVVIGARQVARVTWCPDARAAIAELAGDHIIGVVLELDADCSTDLLAVAGALGKRSVPIPIVVRSDLRRRVAEKVLVFWDQTHDLRLSVRGVDKLSDCVAEIARDVERHAARVAIARRVCTRVPTNCDRHCIGGGAPWPPPKRRMRSRSPM